MHAGSEQVFPLERGGIEQRSHVRLPRFDFFRRRQVGDVGGVVLVGESGEVMAEFVDENIRRPQAVGGDGAVEIEDAAASVGGAVDQDFDELVGREGGNVAEAAVLKRQDVALGAEGVVGGAYRSATVNAGRWPRNAGLG